jgi:outer membrane murein-binding lipoprotein Lpp
MKKTILKYSAMALGFILWAGCSNNTKNKTSTHIDTAVTKGKMDTAAIPTHPEEEKSTANQENYQYDSVSVITGIITTESFYGPPGFGEHPKTDSKEEVYILSVEKPITVISKETDENATNTTKENVSKIQLIMPDNIEAPAYKNKTVRLTGTFFGPQTGHHHTDVLLDVQKAEKL